MTTIALRRVWQLGERFDGGGFAKVFEADADDDTVAVVKLIPKEPGAARELLFEALSGLPNILPVLDTGEWEDYYVLVMPRAEKSLRQHLKEAGGKLAVDEAVVVLVDIAEALASLNAGVVHRDLKPENVLLYKGHWCLADFGIARYAEATTAPDTRKHAMTPCYAAPEQWRAERATNATDVYAFGVMAFELLQGVLPFTGPDFRQQHLDQAPAAISGCPPPLVSLVNECLFKAPAARPTPSNILSRLRASQKQPSPAAARLQAVNRAVIEKQSEEAAKISARQSRGDYRRELFRAAEQSFNQIIEAIRERILQAAPATTVSTHGTLRPYQPRSESSSGNAANASTGHGLILCLRDGVLVIEPVQMAPADSLAAFDYTPPFDVIAYTEIAARKPRDRYGYEGRAHSLWFCDAHDEGVYRWYELAFMVRPMIAQRFTLDPFALLPTDNDAADAFTPVMSIRQIAWQPLPFDQGDEEQFMERWLTWFAAAADGTLSHPSSMPENSGGKFRPCRRRPC